MRMFSHKYPFLLVLIIWITGFFVADKFYLQTIYYYFFLSIATLFFFFFSKKRTLTDILLFITLFLCSWQVNQKESIPFTPSATYRIKSKCEEVLSHNNYILSCGKELFYFPCDSSHTFTPGDSLLITGKITTIKDIGNIGAFNYMRYIKQKGVRYKISTWEPVLYTGRSNNYLSLFQQLRKRLLSKTDALIPSPQINSVVKAIGLGYKNELEAETKQLFSETGTIHLLAVSGLHMSAVYMLFVFIFNLLQLKGKKTKLCIIPLLWGYACLTGLSPSVVRAAQILSFIVIGEAFSKDYIPINSIAASALLTLIIHPYALFSLSMQMSYAAYTGIVLIYPYLNRLPGKLPPIISSFYSLMCISLAAQITTLPLCAYYFHSFSVTSVFINILVVPLTSYLLYTYLFLLAIPLTIGIYLVFTVNYLCLLVFWLLKHFQVGNILLENLYPDKLQILLVYLFSLFFFTGMIRKNKNRLKHSLWITIIFISYSIGSNILVHNKKELIIFHSYRDHCILLNYKGHYSSLIPIGNSSKKNQYMPYIYKNKLKKINDEKEFISKYFRYKSGFLTTNGKTFYLAQKNILPVFPEGIILIVTDNLTPAQVFYNQINSVEEVIIDGSHHYKNIGAWKRFCTENNIPLKSTSEQGSIIIPF